MKLISRPIPSSIIHHPSFIIRRTDDSAIRLAWRVCVTRSWELGPLHRFSLPPCPVLPLPGLDSPSRDPD